MGGRSPQHRKWPTGTEGAHRFRILMLGASVCAAAERHGVPATGVSTWQALAKITMDERNPSSALVTPTKHRTLLDDPKVTL